MSPPEVLTLAELEERHDPWPAPAPIDAVKPPMPYPVESLPDVMREAVAEVQRFTQAPLPLVAGSALAALSVSAQHLADVKRADRLAGPCGLFLLSIAESGERKTTCDGLFLDGLRAWEAEQALTAEPALREYRGRLAAWESAHEGLKNRVRTLAKTQKPTREAADALADHEALKPERPRVPALLRVDDTPEALAYDLAHRWPAAGVISSEAGLVFGSHGMGRESVMRNLALFNTLWDGKPHRVGRRTSEGYLVRGARLTLALQIQLPTLKAFFDQADGLARGTGFLSRFLMAWPESTQGTRLFTEPPTHWPALEAYQRRLRALLDRPPPIQPDGTLAPPVLELDPQARASWIGFHDDVERELRSGGELADVRDVAAKAADNVARLACLFHLLEHGPVGAINADAVTAAVQIVAWHLTEARRFLGTLAVPVELANAADLGKWLVERCRQTATGIVPAGEVLQFGPYAVRRAEARDKALAVLAERGLVRMEQQGRQKLVRVNPRLLASSSHDGPAPRPATANPANPANDRAAADRELAALAALAVAVPTEPTHEPDREALEERAAIYEFEAGLDRAEAERLSPLRR